MAQTRNLCGEFSEQLAATVSGAIRIGTDGTKDYCPDLQLENNYIECKSAGKNGHVIVYEGRREKDREFILDGGRMGGRMLFYWIWHHNANARGVKTEDELRRRWVAGLRYATLVPFSMVDRLLDDRPLKQLNKQRSARGVVNGYGNAEKGYGMGRTLTMKRIKDACDTRIVLNAIPFLDGETINGLHLWTVDRFSYLIRSKFVHWELK
jgi:hypothetical protein